MREKNGNILAKSSLRELYHEYKGELLFFAILALCTILSHWLSRYIPADFFDEVLTPVQNACVVTICFVGAWLMFGHSEGIRVRKIWGYTLLAWALTVSLFMLLTYVFHIPVLDVGAGTPTAFDLAAGNLLAWLLLVYPTETLRPGWLNFRRAAIQLLPMLLLVALNYVLPVDLSPLIALYPFVLGGMLLMHIRAYRQWCEENYSSMEDIDAQWIMRYLIMVLLIGTSFLYMSVTDNPTSAFTQQWLLMLLFTYSTEQILFRRDPWQTLRSTKDTPAEAPQILSEEPKPATESAYTEYHKQLDAWMKTEKPFLNPDFRLMDISDVLPMNRTYLSHLINVEYGCTFYQFVNRYRINEAKHLLRERPYLTIQDVARLSGFSSRIVFTNAFIKDTGMAPREWAKQSGKL